MNEFLNKMERKIGRYAIRNLTLYIIALYVVGYIIQLAPENVNISRFLYLDPYLILKGQIWRLITWVIIPTQGLSIFTLIVLYFYYYIGTSMERTMGTFRYNFFIFSALIATIIAAFITLFICSAVYGLTGEQLEGYSALFSTFFSTYYIQTSVFLTFAICYPEVQVLLMFIIPVRVKWLGILDAVLMGYDIIKAFGYTSIIGMPNYAMLFSVIFQFINLGLFYISTGRAHHLRPGEVKRRNEYKNKSTRILPKGVTRHKCAVCGRTEEDDPNLEFRFCSKCNGNYEYCQDHLFTHPHIK